MKCHTTTYNKQKIFIPGCMGAAVHGKSGCTCYPYVRQGDTLKSLKERLSHHKSEVEFLEKEILKRESKKHGNSRSIKRRSENMEG